MTFPGETFYPEFQTWESCDDFVALYMEDILKEAHNGNRNAIRLVYMFPAFLWAMKRDPPSYFVDAFIIMMGELITDYQQSITEDQPND